jgi:PAS domain S-box-containing protein
MGAEGLANLVELNRDEIVRRWAERAVVALGEHLRGPQLVDHVPALLRSVAESLRAGRVVPGTARQGGDHGEHRHRVGADLEQIVREYGLLRNVIVEIAEETGTPTQARDFRVLDDVLFDALAGAVTEFVRAREEALRESEERYRTLFANMTEGFALGEVIHDEAGALRDFRVLEINEASERHAGLRREDVRGRTVSEVLPNLDPSAAETIGAVVATGEPARFESYDRDLDRHFEVFCYRPSPGRFAVLFTDVTQRRRFEEALRESEARFRALAEAMPQMVWTADARGKVDYLNSRWRAYTGEAADALLEDAWRAIHPEDLGAVRERWAASARTGQPFEFEYRLRRFDGAYRWQLARGLPIRDANGAVARWFGATTDVDDLKRMHDALADADRRKTEFLGVLSHELRNPLAPIRSSLHVLERAPPGSEAACRARQVARRQTEHLTRLVDDLLDVTRISRGKIELRRAPVDLAEIVRRAGEDHRPLLEEHGATLRIAVGREPVWVHGDATRLAQIVGNLLQNASRFTPGAGEVALSVHRRGDAAEIRVRDTGAGIEPSRIAAMFEPFTQGEQTLARTGGGLGLGLALVKGLAEAHGGSAAASSGGPGTGTEVVVRLPLVAAAREDDPPPRPSASRGLRVLVVDDNHDAANSLAELVELFGHEAEVAYDGPEALALARARPPDVVLCDIGLPGMSGYDVARLLRSEGASPRLVAVSGYAQPDDVRRAAEAGFERHIAKPPTPDDIERLLAQPT